MLMVNTNGELNNIRKRLNKCFQVNSQGLF